MSPQHKIINSVIFKPINDKLSNWLSSILSINKGLGDTVKFSKLSLSGFDTLAEKLINITQLLCERQ